MDAAKAGDAIIVRDGIYIENVDVNKRLTIQSENGAEATIVQAANSRDNVFYVTADYVTIRGFTIEGASEYGKGIYISYCEMCNISMNNVLNNYCGVELSASSKNNINSNSISKSHYGVEVYSSSENSIIYNNIQNNWHGIELHQSANNEITRNSVSNSGIGVSSRASSNYIYLNNFVNSKNAVSEESWNFWNSTEEKTYTHNGKTYTNYLGNYWGGYTGNDADGDGIGNTAYDIYSIYGAKDNYPLMETWENYFTEITPTKPTIPEEKPEIPTGKEKGIPGFGAVFAIAGLLTVVYILRKHRE